MPKTLALVTSAAKSFFASRLMLGIQKALEDAGQDIEIRMVEMQDKADAARQKALEELLADASLMGLVYGHFRLNPKQVEGIKAKGLPIAGITERMLGIDWCAVDEVKGAYLATRHILDKGHRKIALLNGPAAVIESRLREEGFLNALSEEGLFLGKEKDLRVLNFSEEEGKDAMNLLLDLPDPPTAVFVAAGDVAALGVMRALRDRFIDCPARVSLVGFDNLEFADKIYPRLSTVNQPLESMAAWAVKRVLAAVEAKESHRCVGEIFQPDLVIRDSVEAPFTSPQTQ